MGLSRKQIVTIVVLVIGAFLGTLNQTIITPVMPLIMNEMGVSAEDVQWLTTGFTLVNAIMIPITAYLTDRFSTRGLFIAAMGTFTLGTLLVAWDPLFALLLIGRLIQAMGAGVLMPMVMIVVMRSIPFDRRGLAMGLYGLVIGGGPALGPTVAGLLIGFISWHAMFLFIALLAGLVIAVSLLVLERTSPRCYDLVLDKRSVVYSTVGFGCLLFGCSILGSRGDGLVAGIAASIGVLALFAFFRRQLHAEKPLLQVRVLSNRAFLIGTLLVMVVQISLVVASVIVPIYVQSLRSLPATTTGLIILPGAIIMGITGPVAGYLFDHHGPRRLAIVGLSVLTLSTFAFALSGTDTAVWYLAVLYAARLFGIALLNMPLTTWSINALDDDLVNHGISVNNTFRQVAGSLGTAMLVSVMTWTTDSQSMVTDAVQAGIFGVDCAFIAAGLMCAVGLALALIFARGDAPVSRS